MAQARTGCIRSKHGGTLLPPCQENEGLLVQPYTLTLKNGVVVKIEEKFYN